MRISPCWPLCLALTLSTALRAQTDATAPARPVDAGRERGIGPAAPVSETVDALRPSNAPDAAPADAQTAQPSDVAGASREASQANASFDILEYRVVGATMLPAKDIERAVYPHLGERRSMKDVEAARSALEKLFQDKGYLTVLVDVPEQKVEGGVVTLRVTEGRIRRVRVTGARYYSLGRIREATAATAAGSVPQVADLQRDLATLNRSADRRVTPVFKPGPTPGTVDMDLKVDDKPPVHGSAELNNLNSANTTPLRLSGSLRYDNLWQADHSLAITLQTAPERFRDARIVSGTYVMPVAGSDAMLAFYGVHSRSDVAAVGSLSVAGNGDILGARGILPLKSSQGFSQSFTLGVDYKHFGQSTKLVGADSIEQPVSYIPFLIQYSGTWTDARGATQFNGGLNFAMSDFLGYNRTSQFELNKRANARGDYAFFRGDLSRTQNLGADWKLVARTGLQLASGPLIGNEQFAAGGSDTVRGYYEAEQLGDHALLGSVEVRTPYPAFVPHERIDDLYALAFVEAANLRLIEALPSQKTSIGLASTGLGLRLSAMKHLRAGIDVAYALRDTTYTHSGDIRMRFKLGYEF